jgi:hypothetical protein
MKSVFIFYSFLIIAFFSSCKKDASNVDMPEFIQKININAFISPDLPENVIFVSSTKPRFGELKGIERIGNLSLNFYEDSKLIPLDTIREIKENVGYYFHIRNFKFKEDHTYHLKVISDLGLEAEASCKVPLKRDFKIKVDTILRNTLDEYGIKMSTLVIKTSITDFPDETNYYRLLYSYDSYLNGNPVRLDLHLDLGDLMKNDIGAEGKEIFLRSLELDPQFINSPYWTKSDSALLKIYLLSTDKPYYNFHTSLRNYSMGDTPFTEPSFLYSNVQGGVGIFASYVVDSLIYRLK